MAVPTPLAKVTLTGVFKVPVPPLALEKNSLVEVELTESVMPPEPAVVLLPKASWSWKPNLTFVVVEAAAEVGVGVIATWAGVPPVIVTSVEPQFDEPLSALTVQVPAASSP